MRLTVSKKDKKRYSKRKTSALQDVVDFGSFSSYDDGEGGVKKASMRQRMAEVRVVTKVSLQPFCGFGPSSDCNGSCPTFASQRKGNKRSRTAPTEESF